MKYCPKCKYEYRDEALVCSDCGETLLIKQKEPQTKEKVVAMQPVKVYSASDKIQAEMIMETMRRQKIPCFSRGVGSGDYLSIYQGFSVYGEDIYVDEADESAAVKVIENFVLLNDENAQEEERKYHTNDEPAEEQMESMYEEEMLEDLQEDLVIPWYRNKTIIARIIVGYLVLMVLLGGVLELLF